MPRKARKVPWLGKRDDTFYANWYETQTRRTRSVSLRTTSDSEAALRFAAFLTKGVAYFSTEPAFRGLSVIDALDAYELEHVNRHVTDKVRQLNAITHLKKYFAGLSLKDVDIAASRGYAEARRGGLIGGGSRHTGDRAKGADSTIRRELNVLRAAAAHALRWRKITHAEMPSIELPRDTRPDEALWLTKPEVDAIFKAAEGPVKDFIALAYFTASRRAAIETLRIEQVDLPRRRINLRAPGSAETKKRRPIVPIHPKILPLVEKLVTGAENGFLFGQGCDFYRPFRETCRRAGIDEGRAHPHVLRHSRATHLLMDGVSIFNVAKLLGDTIQTVGARYGHSCPDHLAAAIGDD
jgi:integrase